MSAWAKLGSLFVKNKKYKQKGLGCGIIAQEVEFLTGKEEAPILQKKKDFS
jgi:hypothetical protein